VDVFVACFANGGSEGFTGDTRNGIFAGGIDVSQNENVGLIESFCEVVPKVFGAGEAMGLKEHE